MGNRSVIGPGGAQFMSAASGAMHDEGPTEEFKESGGVMHGFQLWVNLPAGECLAWRGWICHAYMGR